MFTTDLFVYQTKLTTNLYIISFFEALSLFSCKLENENDHKHF